MTDIIEEMIKEKDFKERVAINEDRKIEIVLKRYFSDIRNYVVYYVKVTVDDLVRNSEIMSYEDAIDMFEELKEKYNLKEVD